MSAAALETSPEALQAAGTALAGASAGALAELARKDPLALAARTAASVAPKDLGAVPKAPQTAMLRPKNVVGGIQADLVGGITLHISEMLDTDAPRPRDATPADMRNLAADLFDAAEAILRKAPNASGEDLRKIMLGNIDAFCRFIDNSQAFAKLADASAAPLQAYVQRTT